MTRSARSLLIRTALAATCAAALAVPVATSAGAAPDPVPPASDAPDDLPSGLVAALARDLGLSTQQAQERLENESEATGVLATVTRLLGGSLAGSWFDPRSEKLTVATTDPDAVAQIEDLGAVAQVVVRSAAQLADRKAELDAKAASRPEGIAGWYVDPVRNSVVVRSTNLIDGVRFGGFTPGVIVEQVPELPRPLALVDGGSALNSRNGVRCSIGFPVSSGRNSFVITAGHCTAFGGRWLDLNGDEIGRSAESTYPDNDFGLVKLKSITPVGEAFVIGDRRVRVPVTGIAPAPIGASVCRSGATTGWVCGTIEGVNETVSYGKDLVNGLTRTTACGELGDSGGPFIAGTEAQGILSGGLGSCRESGDSFFQPIGEILQTYNVELKFAPR